MKNNNLPVHLSKLRTVTEDYAAEHMEELLKNVNQNNEAAFVQNEEDMAVLVPYWWYMTNFGSDVQKIVEYLFEESREQSLTNAMVNLGIVDGYLSHVSRIVGKDISEALMERMEGHPHAVQWQALHDEYSRQVHGGIRTQVFVQEPLLPLQEVTETVPEYQLFDHSKSDTRNSLPLSQRKNGAPGQFLDL